MITAAPVFIRADTTIIDDLCIGIMQLPNTVL